MTEKECMSQYEYLSDLTNTDMQEEWSDLCCNLVTVLEGKNKEINELKSTLVYVYDWYGMFMGDVAKDKIKKAIEGGE